MLPLGRVCKQPLRSLTRICQNSKLSPSELEGVPRSGGGVCCRLGIRGIKGIRGIRGFKGIKGLKSPPFTFHLLSVISLYFVNNFLGGKDVLGTKVVIFVAIFLIVAICRNVVDATLQQTVSCNHTNIHRF